MGAPLADRWEALYSEHKELLDAFGSVALSLGRLPGDGEFARISEVAKKLGSLKRGLRAFVQGGGVGDLTWGQVAERFGFGVPERPQWQVLCEQHKDLLESFWKCALELGRMPAPEEFVRHSELVEAVGSAKRGMTLLERKGGADAIRRAAEACEPAEESAIWAPIATVADGRQGVFRQLPAGATAGIGIAVRGMRSWGD